MTADQLYAALTAEGWSITEDRLRKASKKADSPAVYAALLERLASEGRWPLRVVDPDVGMTDSDTLADKYPPVFVAPDVSDSTAAVEPAREPLPGDVMAPATSGYLQPVDTPKKKRPAKKAKKASKPVGKKKSPKKPKC